MLEFGVFMGLVVLRVGLLAIGALFLLRPVTRCPACFQSSLPLVSWTLGHLFPWLERRWCPHCGWQGLGRRARTPG
jgi:hypothetical protein